MPQQAQHQGGRLAVGVAEAGWMLGVSAKTVQRLVAAGTLRAKKVLRRTVIETAELQRYLQSR